MFKPFIAAHGRLTSAMPERFAFMQRPGVSGRPECQPCRRVLYYKSAPEPPPPHFSLYCGTYLTQCGVSAPPPPPGNRRSMANHVLRKLTINANLSETGPWRALKFMLRMKWKSAAYSSALIWQKGLSAKLWIFFFFSYLGFLRSKFSSVQLSVVLGFSFSRYQRLPESNFIILLVFNLAKGYMCR